MKKLVTDELDLASGRVTIRVLVDDGVYFEVLSDISGYRFSEVQSVSDSKRVCPRCRENMRR